MTLLYFSDSSIPSFSANSVHVMKMCQAFSENGASVTLIGKNTNACVPNVENKFEFYDVKPVFRLKIFPGKPFPGSGRLYNLVLPFLILGNTGLVYTRSIYAAFWCCVINRRFVWEIHEPFENKGRFLRTLFRFIIRRRQLQKIVVITDALRQFLVKKYELDVNRIIVSHDGADEVRHLQDDSTSNKNFSVGYVGSLVTGKGVEVIVPLAKACPDIDFHVVGGSPEQVRKFVSTVPDDQKNIHFHGNVPHRETHKFIAGFDVMVAPYQKNVYVKSANNSNNIALWMSPLKLFEYMASRKPIVISDIDVLHEVVEHRKEVLFCPSDNLTAWREAIYELKNDSTLRKTVAENAYHKFMSNYTWKSRAKTLLKKIAE